MRRTMRRKRRRTYNGTQRKGNPTAPPGLNGNTRRNQWMFLRTCKSLACPTMGARWVPCITITNPTINLTAHWTIIITTAMRGTEKCRTMLTRTIKKFRTFSATENYRMTRVRTIRNCFRILTIRKATLMGSTVEFRVTLILWEAQITAMSQLWVIEEAKLSRQLLIWLTQPLTSRNRITTLPPMCRDSVTMTMWKMCALPRITISPGALTRLNFESSFWFCCTTLMVVHASWNFVIE